MRFGPPPPLCSSLLLTGAGPGNGGGAPLPPVAGPLIWLYANQATFADNDPVGQFTDWSGNGNHFTSSGSARPTFRTNRINGRPSVRADGVDDGLLLASMGACTNWTAYVVGRLITDPGTQRNFLSIDDFGPDTDYILLQYNGSSTVIVNHKLGGIVSASMVAGTVDGYCLTGSASLGTLRASDNTGNTRAANYSKLSAPMRLFRRNDGFFVSAEISEFLFYGTTHDTATRTTVWTYFNTRYGTAIPASP